MNDDREMKQLWQDGARDERIDMERERLIASLRRANQKMRWVELSDLSGGIVLLAIVVYLVLRDPSAVGELPAAAIVGGSMLLGTFVVYHVQAYLARRRSAAAAPTLVQLLQDEKRRVDRRIALLSRLGWYLVVSLAGLLMVVASLGGSVTATAIVLVGLIVFGFVIHRLGSSALDKEYLPLRAGIAEQLKALRE